MRSASAFFTSFRSAAIAGAMTPAITTMSDFRMIDPGTGLFAHLGVGQVDLAPQFEQSGRANFDAQLLDALHIEVDRLGRIAAADSALVEFAPVTVDQDLDAAF